MPQRVRRVRLDSGALAPAQEALTKTARQVGISGTIDEQVACLGMSLSLALVDLDRCRHHRHTPRFGQVRHGCRLVLLYIDVESALAVAHDVLLLEAAQLLGA